MTATARHPAATAARAALGRQLAARRRTANLTQRQLSYRTHFERSTIANVEIGRSAGTGAFWEACDRVLPDVTTLLSAYLKYRQDLDALRDAGLPARPAVGATAICGPDRVTRAAGPDGHDPTDRPRLRLVSSAGLETRPSQGLAVRTSSQLAAPRTPYDTISQFPSCQPIHRRSGIKR